MAKSNFADRGKWAEKQVTTLFSKLNERIAQFAFERIPDARAARGAFKATVADYMVMWLGKFYLVEVKEVKHDFRLPYSRLEQRPRINKWVQAGSSGIVLIYHSTTKKWRSLWIQELNQLVTETGASWDLRDFNTYSTETEALVAIGVFHDPV